MASVKPGTYSISDLLRLADFDFEKEAAADYNNGAPDFRRVQVGGLPFDNLSKEIRIPATADQVVITLDGADHAVLDVDLSDEEHQAAREYSFETAADSADSRIGG